MKVHGKRQSLHKRTFWLSGGGPAGLSAAIAAGRLGARTMIVERYGSLGGVLTQVGVESFAGIVIRGRKIVKDLS